MRPQASIRESLAELLLATDSRAQQAAQVLDERCCWHDAVENAAAWRVAPRLFSQIARLNLTIPEAAAFALRRHMVAAYSHSAFVASKGIEAMGYLQAAGIRAAAFKGLASMARLYGDPKWRTIHDVDLLVAPRDLPAAVSILEHHGFLRNVDASLDQYSGFVAHSPAFAGNKAITLRGKSEIDLHWAVGRGLDPAELLDRCEVARLFDREFAVVSPEDAILLTARHAAREDLAIDGAFRDLIDLKLAFSKIGPDRLAERAAAAGMTALLLAIGGILQLYDAASPDLPASPRDRRESARLIELFEIQLREGPLGKDLLYVAHNAPLRQIVSGLVSNAAVYRRFMRVFETENQGRPLPWSKRFLRLAGSAGKLGPRRFLCIRALARVKYD